VLFNTWKST